MKVSEIKGKLLAAGLKSEDLDKLKKPELEQMLSSIEILDNVQEVKDNPASENVEPTPADSNWTEYVMKMFTPDELEEGNPKVDGLRRIATKLYGDFSTKTKVVQPPTLDTGATVVVTLEFPTVNNGIISVDGAADVSSENTDSKFAVHAVATAETRAEGRALRRALKLVKVLAAEELHNAQEDEPNGSDGRIPSSMLNSLKMMSEKQKIDLDKLSELNFQVTSSDELTILQGRKLGDLLFKFKQGQEQIPEEVKLF